ncbi:MAG: ComEC/Rec2 family competence protein [Clostridia bacterium]|nr:ComEC/Rec2 family competence protein [Clostridia bacterium]
MFRILFVYAPTTKLEGTSARFEGVIIREPEIRDEWTVYTLEGRHSMMKGKFKCNIILSDSSYNIGDRLNVNISSRIEDDKYRNNNLADGIYLSTYVKEIKDVSVAASPFYHTLGKLREFIKTKIYSVCKDDTGGVMLALLTGNRQFISDSLYEKTKICGVTHILVVSGLHVGILSGVLLKFLSKIKLKQKISVIICLLLLFLLVALCDFHSSAIRSVIMGTIMLLGTLISRRADPLNSLGFAVTVMTLINPFIAGSPSFLLSVFATFGVIFLAPMLEYLTYELKLRGRFARILNGAFDIIIVSVSATVCILPISTFYFGYISPLSAPVTVLIGLAVEFSLVLSALGVILSSIPFIKIIAIPVFYIAGIFTKYINLVIDFFGNFSFLLIDIDPKHSNLTFIFSSLLILTVWILYNNKKLKERKKNDAAEREDSKKLS